MLSNSSDARDLYEHLINGYIYMAMTNYPYPSSFLEPMPGYPVNVAAAYFDDIEYPPTTVDWARKETVLKAIL